MSASQEESRMNLFVHHHQLYNWALPDRIETYREYDYGLNFSEQCKVNTLWRNERKAHGIFNANAQSEQVTLKRVALAFDGFFRRLKKGSGKAGSPRFKPSQRFKGWGYKSHGDGWKLHQKIARQRLDFTHKETAKLVEMAALITTEKLTVNNMTRSAKGTAEKHGKMVKQKAD